MPVLHKAIRIAESRLPKVVSPTTHAVADYLTAALFFAGSVLFWRKSKRAAVASLICGAAEIGVAAFTDYPGGVKHPISFPLHRKIDFGLSSMTATMPDFLAFEDEKEKAFFRTQSILMAGVTVLTDFAPRALAGERERKAA
jgi:hypothetical protein